MSEQREALAEALCDVMCMHEPGYHECYGKADRVLASDALAQMLAEAFRKGREMGVTNANVNAERDGYRRGQAEVAAAVEAVLDKWGADLDGFVGYRSMAADLRAALTPGAGDRVRAEEGER